MHIRINKRFDGIYAAWEASHYNEPFTSILVVIFDDLYITFFCLHLCQWSYID